jgi:hypothetical protein
MARYHGGASDTYTWQINVLQEPIDDWGNPTAGCAAFPITIQENARSVTAPGTGSNPYPDPAEFTYPTNPPIYASFQDHQDDRPLLNATPGDIYRVYHGSGSGNFGWLLWNIGLSANAATLAHSLSWPGDSIDYNPCSGPGCPGGTGVPGSGFPTNVWGYIEPGDPADQALHVADWIATSTGSLNATDVRAQLQPHIDLGRTLRLPIWNNNSGGQVQTSQFGIFRLIGYNTTENWLLLEFIDFDTSCGQLPVAPTSVTIAGPAEGTAETSYSFTATVNPVTTTTPVTYTWEIANHDTITNTDGISNTIMLNWNSEGSKTVTVTAVNSTGFSVSQSHTIDIAQRQLYLPFVTKK